MVAESKQNFKPEGEKKLIFSEIFVVCGVFHTSKE